MTDNQPVSYLEQLEKCIQPTILLMVVPEAREETVWRELIRRLKSAGISTKKPDVPEGMVRSITTQKGPILALTSWPKLLSALELEAVDHPRARSDLLQLCALCEAADNEAFLPISSTEITNQRTPTFILQLGSIVQASVDLAVTEGLLNIDRLNPQASWGRIGRYARFAGDQGIGIWFGVHFGLWQKYGGTPLWLLFSSSEFGRARDVRPLLEPWAFSKGIFTTWENDEFGVAIDIEVGEEKDRVIRVIVDRLKEIGRELSAQRSKNG